VEIVKPTFQWRTSRIQQVYVISFISFYFIYSLRKQPYKFCLYSRNTLIGINRDGQPPGYAENSDNFIFFISNFRRVLYVVRFLLGNSPASAFYMPTFRNTLSAPSL